VKVKKMRNDLLLAASLLLIALILAGILYLMRRNGAQVIVTVDGAEVFRGSLAAEQTVRIDGVGGGYNLITIRDGAAFVEEASCPDKLCVHRGRLRYAGETAVCLPNRVVVRIEGGPASGADAEVG